MNSIANFLERTLMPVADKLNRNKYLTSIRDGLVVTMPFLIFGSVCLLIPNFPGINYILSEGTLQSITQFFSHGFTITLNLTALVIAFSIAYNLAEKEGISPLYTGFTGLFAFLMLLPISNDAAGSLVLSLPMLGAQGMFLAIITAIIAAKISKLVKWDIKMPASVPPAISGSFASLIPIVITLFIFLGIRGVFALTPYGNALDMIYDLLQKPLVGLGNNLGSMMLVAFLIQFLWFFGLHGNLIVSAVWHPIIMTLSQQNFDLMAAGKEPVNIINTQFHEIYFGNIGGSSSILALAIVLMFLTKRKELNDIGKLGVVPALFNITEPIMFGVPIVMNPYMFIPLVIGPMITIPIAYFATAWGLVPLPQYVVPWTTPPLINGFLTTGSIMGSVVQLIQIAIQFVLWIIAVKMMDHQPNDAV